MVAMRWSRGLRLIFAESFLGGILSKVIQPWFVFFGWLCLSFSEAYVSNFGPVRWFTQSASVPRPPFVSSPLTIWTLIIWTNFPKLVLSFPPFVLCTSLCHPSVMAQRQTAPPFPGLKIIQFLLTLVLFFCVIWNLAFLYSENFPIMN